MANQHEYPIGALFFVTWSEQMNARKRRRWALYTRAEDGGYDCLISAKRAPGTVREPEARKYYPPANSRLQHVVVSVPNTPAVHMLITHNQIDKACELLGDPWRNQEVDYG